MSGIDHLALLLAEAEPILRERLHRRRTRKDPSWDTSDAFASVRRRVLSANRGKSIVASGSTERRQWWAYLGSVVRAVLVDGYRRVAQQQRFHASDHLDARFAGSPPAVPDPDGAERLAAVRDLLESLDPIDRAILGLRIGGNSWTSVALGVGLTETACRQRHCRAIKTLRVRATSD